MVIDWGEAVKVGLVGFGWWRIRKEKKNKVSTKP